MYERNLTMDKNIIKILDLEASGLHITNVEVRDGVKRVFMESKPALTFCPMCSYRMHSRGIHKREINHPVMQDGLALTLVISQRRWRCTNSECKHEMNEDFSFVEKYRRNTNMSDFLIVDAFRDPELSVSQIAQRFNVSDSHALITFLRYVDMPRRQLSEAVSIDEVHLNISYKQKYALVIQDFITGEPIDLVSSRRKEFTLPYFSKIPRGERIRVKYLITDMYEPYRKYIDDYFPNAVHVVDAFHVISLINRAFESYLLSVQRRIKASDERRHDKLEQELGRHIPFTDSIEYYLLKKKRWTVLRSEKNNATFKKPVYDHRMKKYMTLGEYQAAIYAIDPDIRTMQKLKDRYIRFNEKCSGNPDMAKTELKKLIGEYKTSGFREFESVADTMESNYSAIINSFVMVERINRKTGEIFKSRLSNGPIESVNRIVKDMKRNARGYRNFENVRNRFLFSQRPNAKILARPKTVEEIRMRESTITSRPKKGNVKRLSRTAYRSRKYKLKR